MFTKIHSACDYFGKIFILSFCLIHFCAYSHAGTAHPKPSLKQTSQHLPENISLKKAHLLKLKYEGELENTTNTTINEESFLSALLAYDNSRYSTDLKDPTSILGDYKQRLDIAYASLSEKHISYLDFNKKSQLENKISALEHLINSRKLAQQSTSELP